MSRNITIQEGGSAVQLTVDKLKTDQVGGGSVRWVPEDEVSLGTKHITENGEYSAAADDKYGYSVVTVNVPGGAGGPPGEEGSSIIGIDPDDGEEYVISIDENGEIVSKMMPSGIQITTLPSDLDYVNGETIDFTGIVVKLKKHDGTVYTDENYPDGVIPFAELTFPVTTAVYDGGGGASGYSSDLDTSPAIQPIQAGGTYEVGSRNISIQGTGAVFCWAGSETKTRFCAICASDVYGGSSIVYNPGSQIVPATLTATFNGKTVYYQVLAGSNDVPIGEVQGNPIITTSSVEPSSEEIAWTLVYGTYTSGSAGQANVVDSSLLYYENMPSINWITEFDYAVIHTTQGNPSTKEENHYKLSNSSGAFGCIVLIDFRWAGSLTYTQFLFLGSGPMQVEHRKKRYSYSGGEWTETDDTTYFYPLSTTTDPKTKDGKTWYYHSIAANDEWDGGSYPVNDFPHNSDTRMFADAWNILFGDAGSGGPASGSGTQTVPVQWPPPASKFPSQKTRSTAYEINVTASSNTTGGTTVDNEGFSGNEGNF